MKHTSKLLILCQKMLHQWYCVVWSGAKMELHQLGDHWQKERIFSTILLLIKYSKSSCHTALEQYQYNFLDLETQWWYLYSKTTSHHLERLMKLDMLHLILQYRKITLITLKVYHLMFVELFRNDHDQRVNAWCLLILV